MPHLVPQAGQRRVEVDQLGQGQRGEQLADHVVLAEDPAGAQACHQLAGWINGDLKDPDTGKPLKKGIAATVLAQDAIKSTTPAVKAAAGTDLMDDPVIAQVKAYGGPASLRFADLPALHAACVAAGEKMPAYVERGA